MSNSNKNSLIARLQKLKDELEENRYTRKIVAGPLAIYRKLRYNESKQVSLEEPTPQLIPNIDYDNLPPDIKIKISVIYPTKNGGELFAYSLKMMINQLGIDDIEIIVVDSGSTDETVKIAKMYGAKVIEIRPEEFSHSYSRNLGAQQATGDYILFMTQDAVPTDDYWLYKFVMPLYNGSVVAASAMETQKEYGDLKYKIDNYAHNKYLGVYDCDKIGKMPKKDDWQELRKNAQLSDISCIVKKDVFLKYKYRGDFAEDLRLGIDILRSGERIALLSSVRSVHAHSRMASYYMKRNLVDISTIKEILPQYPMEKYDYSTILSMIKNGYVYICGIIKEIKTIPENTEMIHVYEKMEEILEEERISSMDIEGAFPYQDENMYEFLYYIFKQDWKDTKQTRICDEVKEYVLGPMKSYIFENEICWNEQFSLIFEETIYKTFCAYIGTHLAEYAYWHKNSDPIIDVIAQLRKGV